MADIEITDELDAINAMLLAIGESPVNSLSNPGVDVVSAKKVLDRIRRQVQVKGWYFNTEKEYPLSVQGFAPYHCIIPTDAISVDTSACESSLQKVAVRGTKLYNLEDHTYSFEGRSTIKVDIVFNLPFDGMTEAARQYVGIRAIRKFQNDVVGDDTPHVVQKEDEREALQAFRRDQARNSDRNMFNNTSSQNILDRRI